MRRWLLSKSLVFRGLRCHRPRCYSAVVKQPERLNFRTGSTGEFTIELHNVAQVPSSTPLMVYLPPFSTASTEKPVPLPKFIQRRPTVVINYRWAGFNPFQKEELRAPKSADQSDEDEPPYLSWPIPLHDTSIAYDWIVENLCPANNERRDVYLYGSYLGASLATSLALTRTDLLAQMRIRGCIAYNGIYNWTTFLPDHRIKQLQEEGMEDIPEGSLSEPNDPDFLHLETHAEALFGRPDHLFDPFASACLFFHNPGLYVPPTFDKSALASLRELLLELAPSGQFSSRILRSPPRTELVYPPTASTLTIPKTLLLHSGPAPKRPHPNNFGAQARRLAALMRRSLGKKSRFREFKWEGTQETVGAEIARKIMVAGVGSGAGDYNLGDKGQKLAEAWLEERLEEGALVQEEDVDVDAGIDFSTQDRNDL